MKATHPSIERVRKIAHLLDSAITIPIIRKKIGLDPLLGLFPAGGDAVALLLAVYALWVAYDLGLPRSVMIRMSVNILMDFLIGLIPVVGDVADMFWKSNQMNLQLLEAAYQSHLNQPQSARHQSVTVDIFAEPVI